MEQQDVSRRRFLTRTAALAGAAGAVLSVEEQHLMAFQQGGPPPQGAPGRQGGAPGQAGAPGGRGPQQVAIPDIPGPVPTLKLGGLEISRLLAGHNLVVGQAHESGSGLLYISGLLRAYFTDEKVLETFAMYEKHGINCSGARMADNMVAFIKKYRAQGGKLKWMAGISSERDIAMANDAGCELGYVHGNTADGAMRQADPAGVIGKLLDAMQKAKMVSGICCHSIDVVTACEKAGIKPAFYVKTFNPVNYYMNGGGAPEASAGREPKDAEAVAAATKRVTDIMDSVKVPFIGFKTLGAGRALPKDAFAWSFQKGCDGMLVGMYDFQVAANANLTKQILQAKDKIVRTRGWFES